MKIRKSAGTPNGIELLLKRLTGLRIFMAKLIFSHEDTKEKAQKLAEKRNISYFCSKIKRKKMAKEI